MPGKYLRYLLSVLLITLLSSCAGDSGGKNPVNPDDNGNGNGNQTDDVKVGEQVFLSDNDFSSLAMGNDLFNRLSETKDLQTARQELIDSLETWESLSDVTLWEDGSTISVRFSEGNIGLITTPDPDMLGGSAYAAPQPTRLRESIPERGLFKPSSGLNMPDTSSVLILEIAEDLWDSWIHTISLKNIFTDAGWPSSEIDIIRAEGPESDTITPETLITEPGKYGIVFIIAHGLYGRPYPTVFSQHYIQFAYNYERPYWGSYKDTMQQWVNEWKILPGEKYLYMRQDLLEELMADLPGSIVYLSTCWGYYARNAFLNNGANSVFCWDHEILTHVAFDNAELIARQMSLLKPSPSDDEVFENTAIIKSSGNADFHLENNDNINYYPGWIDFTFNASVLPFTPAGFSIRVSSPKLRNDPQYIENTGSGSIPFKYIFPGEREVEISAQDKDGNTVMYFSREEKLRAGQNEVDLTLSNINVGAQWLRHTYEDGFDGFGPYTTAYFTYYTFPIISNVSSLYTFYHDDLDNYHSPYASTSYYPQDTEGKTGHLDLYTQEDIIEKYGKDIFGVGSDNVIHIEEGTMYGHHKGEDTISEWLAEADSVYQTMTPFQWYDVYYFEPK